MSLQLRSVKPDASIADFVQVFWMLVNDGEEDVEATVLPDGIIDLFVIRTSSIPFMIELKGIDTEPSAVVVSVFAEALLLAIMGGVLGGGVAWILFNGHAVSTNGGGLTQLSVPLAVDLQLIGFGVLWACAIGMVGAAFPAIRAARAPLAAALRGI